MVSTSFFWTWPTWAKLSFALGATLVIVLAMAGLVKLRKMVKTRTLDQKIVADPEIAGIRLRGRSSDEIPFGAKAMLEDPDVEGVWNSRASTPLQSPVLEPRRSSPSRNPFSRSRRNSSISSLSQLNAPDNNNPNHLTEPENLPPSNLDGTPTSTAPLFSRNSSDTPWQYKVPTPYAHETFPRRRSVTIRATSKQDSIAEKTAQYQPQSSAIEIGSKRRGRVSTDPIPATPTHERRGRTLILSGPALDSAIERTPTTRKALDRMEAHRKFHAAESGQLQPRLRSLDEKSLGHKHSTSDHTASDHESTRAVSWPITSGEVLVDFIAPQKTKIKVSPLIVPFRAIVETHQPSKIPVKAPPSAWTDRTQGMLEEKLESQGPKKRITIKNDCTDKDAKELFTIINRNNAEVEQETASLLGTQVRRINKGFEVLPAGSLGRSELTKDFGYEKESIQETSHDTSRPRKLQKKSRSRSRESQRSSIETARHVEV